MPLCKLLCDTRPLNVPGGGGELLYETDGDARQKMTNLGVAQALFEP